jgi:hypothetical protein
LICGIGLASMAGLVPWLADYTYPIVWWGLLLIVDRYNERRHRLSLWRSRGKHFLLITIPVSVLLWLLFEILNLAAPQWRYKGGIDNLHAQVFFGFISFATVIPIMEESYWLAGGRFCLPAAFSRVFQKWRAASILAGLVFAAIPLFNDVFWFNQGIWLAPALVLLPFTNIRPCESPPRFVRALALSGLLAGFFWEMLNYWSRTHWEYLILPGAPHLFQMPLPGYLGFIPFALTALVVYEQQLRLPPRITISALLYAGAFAALYVLTTVYLDRGLWLLK